ncbi:MAG: DUF4384 domain-containing protein [Treponema sp.]|jgi:hypothetical protein|nr:DUF4384 domain-containing protein [Treponema sp.]
MFRVVLCLAAAALAAGCASPGPAGGEDAVPEALSLEEALRESAGYFGAGLSDGRRIALMGVEADSAPLADYVTEELWNCFERSGRFTMVDRRNTARIQEELRFQAEGLVDDESAQRIGRLYGAETIVYGRIRPLGGGYRLVLYATDVERGVSSQQAKTVRPDARWDAPPGPAGDPDAAVDRAVEELARRLEERTTVAVGRIGLGGGATVTSLSDFLKKRITHSAARRYTRYRVVGGQGAASAGPPAPAVQALIEGSFTPLGEDAEVTLELVSAGGDRQVLGTGVFTISGAELRRRGLSVLPPQGAEVIDQGAFEEKQKALAPYKGGGAFGLSVRPNDPDGVYYDGESLSFTLRAERDCYFKITHVDVYGKTQCIYPLDRRDNNFLKAGEARQLPDNTVYRLTEPFGEEYILIAAYDKPFRVNAEAPAPLSAAVISRGLTVESPAGAAAPAAAALFSYTILPRDQ